MRSRRWISVLIAGMLLLGACTSSSDTTEVSDDEVANEEEQSGQDTDTSADSNSLEGKVIGSVQFCQNCEGMLRVQQGIEGAAEALGMEVNLVDAQGDPAAALSGVNNLVQAGVDAILLGAVAPSIVQTGLEKAEEAGIPVITIFGNEPSPLIRADVTAESFTRGAQIATALTDGIGYEGEVALVTFPLTSDTQQREIAARSVLAEFDDIEIVCEHQMDITKIPEDTRSAVETCLQNNPDLDGLIEITGIGVEGTIQAIREADKVDQVKVYSMDCFSFELEFIRQGQEEACSAIPYAYPGWLAVDQVREILTGGEASAERIYVPSFIVHENNLIEEEYFEAQQFIGDWESDLRQKWGV